MLAKIVVGIRDMVGLEPPGDSTSERWKNYIKNKESTNKVKTSKAHPNYDG